MQVTATASTATSYTDRAVSAGVTYEYRVKAINAHGVGAQSHAVQLALPSPPAARADGVASRSGMQLSPGSGMT